jgi:hypothetical protein
MVSVSKGQQKHAAGTKIINNFYKTYSTQIMIDDTLVARPLFGGAVELALPDRFVDISDFRPIPDSQEVFADSNLDQSLIIECVEHQTTLEDADSAAFYFADLATNNAAAHAQLSSQLQLGPDDLPWLPRDVHKALAIGEQAISKGRQQGIHALNKVQIALCIVRLPLHQTDVLITLNTPIYIAEGSAAAEHAGAGFKGEFLAAPELFRKILATFKILDYGLFGGAPETA